MTTHNPLPTTIGCSWGWTPADPSTLDPYFQKMAAQGQNFFVASGDSSTWSSRNRSLACRRCLCGFGGRHGPDDIERRRTLGLGNRMGRQRRRDQPRRHRHSRRGRRRRASSTPAIAARPRCATVPMFRPTRTSLSTFAPTRPRAPPTATAGPASRRPCGPGFIALVNQQRAANGQGTVGFINPTIYNQNVTSSLLHQLPRHHQRHVGQLLGRDRLRPCHRLGQSQAGVDRDTCGQHPDGRLHAVGLARSVRSCREFGQLHHHQHRERRIQLGRIAIGFRPAHRGERRL